MHDLLYKNRTALKREDLLSYAKRLQLDPSQFEKSLDELLNTGLNNLGMYHAKRPLLMNEQGDIITQDLNLLYFYHNRLVGYNLEKYVG